MKPAINSVTHTTAFLAVKFKFSSCQETEELVPASSDDEGLW